MRRADPETQIQHTEPLLSVCQNTALQLGQPLTKAHTFTKCDNTTGWPVCNDMQQGAVNQVF